MIHLKESLMKGVHAVSSQFGRFAQTYHYGGRTMFHQVRMSRVALLSCAVCLSLPATTWALQCGVEHSHCKCVGTQGPGGPQPGDPFHIDVSGGALADVNPGAGELSWELLEMTGFSPQFGNMAFFLNPDIPSTGFLEGCPDKHCNNDVLISCIDDPDCPAGGVCIPGDCFENTNSFFFRLDTQTSGALVSDDPVIVRAIVTELPPTATYTMAGPPVDFYRIGDPFKTIVLTINTASVEVQPETSPIPTVSAWGVVVMALALLIVARVYFSRRNALRT